MRRPSARWREETARSPTIFSARKPYSNAFRTRLISSPRKSEPLLGPA